MEELQMSLYSFNVFLNGQINTILAVYNTINIHVHS